MVEWPSRSGAWRRPGFAFHPILVATLSFAFVSVLGLADGGYLQRTWRLSLLALAAVVGAALLARDRIEIRRGGLCMVGALAALAGWTALSTIWADVPTMPPAEAERSLLYVLAVLAVLLACTERSLPYLLGGMLAGVTVDCAYGLLRYVFWPPARSPVEGTLLFLPLGYANAVGVFAVLGIVMALGLALWGRGWIVPGLSLAPLFVLVPTLSLTSSRGAWAALPFGIATLLFVAGRIRSVALLVPLLAGAVIGGILLGSSSGQAISFVGQNRPQYWHVAWKLYESNSLLGGGAGTFGNFWLHNRSNGEFVQDAHSLYIETLAELGPVGLVLLLLVCAAPLAAMRRRGDLATGRRDDVLLATALGCYVTFLLHAAVDWDWEMPAVTILGLGCGAAALVGARGGRAIEMGRYARGALLAAVSGVAAFVSARLGSTSLLSLAWLLSPRNPNRVSGKVREERPLDPS